MKRKNLLLPILILTLLAFAVFPVQGQGNVQATINPAVESLTVGDPVDLTIEVIHPAGYQVIFPQLEETWGPFEVQHQSAPDTISNGDGSETTRQTVTVTLFNLGAFETPALPINLSSPEGQLTEIIALPVTLNVTPTLPQGDTELRDIRPQIGLDTGSLLPVLLVSALALALAGVGVWQWRKRKKIVVDNRPPHQRALDELARIKGLNLPQKGDFKGYYTAIADTLRAYIEEQFEVSAFDRTTSELRYSLQGARGLSPAHARQMIDLFMDADLVKFADLRPEIVETEEFMASAHTLVLETIPQPEPEIAKDDTRPLKPVSRPEYVNQPERQEVLS